MHLFIHITVFYMELQKHSQCYCKLSGPKPERPSKPYLKYILTPQHISKKM